MPHNIENKTYSTKLVTINHVQTTRLLKLHKIQEITLLVILNITHLQQHKNPNPKNTNQNPIKFAKETCITQKIVTTNMCFGISNLQKDYIPSTKYTEPHSHLNRFEIKT
jgi:hypothetical protein